MALTHKIPTTCNITLNDSLDTLTLPQNMPLFSVSILRYCGMKRTNFDKVLYLYVLESEEIVNGLPLKYTLYGFCILYYGCILVVFLFYFHITCFFLINLKSVIVLKGKQNCILVGTI